MRRLNVTWRDSVGNFYHSTVVIKGLVNYFSVLDAMHDQCQSDYENMVDLIAWSVEEWQSDKDKGLL